MRFTDPKSRRWTENARKQQVQAYWQINNTTTHFFHFTLQMMNNRIYDVVLLLLRCVRQLNE